MTNPTGVRSNENPLRFAVLCRVSTEAQERRGESLKNQAEQMATAVATLGGTITREYAGQQHATAGYEHQLVEKLLHDARLKRKPFDAVMVADPSRWSRDNVANETGLDTLRDNGIRFFVQTTEHDLYDPTARFMLTQFASVNAYYAKIQKVKSVHAKVSRAKAGRPAAGALPWGRTWDAERLAWGVEEAKRELIAEAAQRYLGGESLKNLAAEYGMDHSTLHDVLRNRCGPTFTQRFRVADLQIDETVETTVPRLLPANTIRAVRRRMDRQHKGGGVGNNKHQYLLGGHVRCIVCGACMSPQHNNGVRYYRRAAGCTHIDGMVRADDLEVIVASQLIGLMGNPAAVSAAADAAQAAVGDVANQRAKVEALEEDLAKIKRARKRHMRALDDDLVDEAEVMDKLKELRDREHKLTDKRDRLAETLAEVPTKADVAAAAKRAKRRLQLARRLAHNATVATMAHEELKALIKEGFANTTHPNGSWPGGVFIKNLPEWKGRRPRRWAYEIHGNLPGTGVDYGHTDLPSEAFARDNVPESNYANASGAY